MSERVLTHNVTRRRRSRGLFVTGALHQKAMSI